MKPGGSGVTNGQDPEASTYVIINTEIGLLIEQLMKLSMYMHQASITREVFTVLFFF